MTKQELEKALYKAEQMPTGTRAEKKLKKAKKISLRKGFIGERMRKVNAEAADENHYTKLSRNKAKTMNKPIVKAKKFKSICKPGIAHPVASKTGDSNWDKEKTERAEMKRKAIIGRKAVERIPNKGMADATEQYSIQCCWEAIENGNINAWEALRALTPDKKPEPKPIESEQFFQLKHRVQKLEDAKAGLAVEFQRLEKNEAAAKARFESAHKLVPIAKAMVTKARKMYNNASDEDKQARYDRMAERNRHLNVILQRDEKAQTEYEFRHRIMLDFADTWEREETKLNERIRELKLKLSDAMRAHRHEKLQEVLEDVFAQRYERAEKVPEKEDSDRYKVLNVAAAVLHGLNMKNMLDEMNRYATEKPASWVLFGRAIFLEVVKAIEEQNGPFVVDVKDCVVNNVARSEISDILAVEYGQKTPCKEILSVNYDVTGIFKVYWKFVDSDYDEAQRKLHDLRVKVVKKLITHGVELVDEDKQTFYDLLAASPSQQKKGQGYMAERNALKAAEKLLEFGWTMDEAIARRPDNAAEWLKRNATLMTPSKFIKDENGNFIKIQRILMTNDVEIDRWFDRVTTIDGRKLSKAERKKLKQTLFDGQAQWLKEGMPSTQMRGTALKAMAVALADYKLPEFAIDIMGNKVRVADYDILMTKSCWKASKMGMNWYEFRDKVTELAKVCPGYDCLRAVRYSDREIGDEENPRNLARQATQQWVTMPDEDIEKLTRATRRWLKRHKKYSVLLAKLGEYDKPAEERSPLARLFNKIPQLIMHKAIQQWLKSWWTAKRDKACSGRIRTTGMYPYIVQDPIAMIQILLEGRDPNEEGLGVVPEGMVNLPKVRDGRKVYAIRYPANYMVGMVLTQINVPQFRNLGNVAVLSYYGDTIVRADGDFDGDEMLFIFSQIVIDTMERIIKEYEPTLIDFPHAKVPCNKPFGTMENFINEVAEALVRAQEYNLVGLYSNLAVICLQQASIAKDPLSRGKWLNAAKIAHVGAIVCLDMVKGADVPKELKEQLEQMNSTIREQFKMPWNQLFSHKELTSKDVEKRSMSTQDRIAGLIYDEAGEFSIEFDENDDVASFGESNVQTLMPDGVTTNFRKFIISDDDMRVLRGCRFEDTNDTATLERLAKGEAIGLKDWMLMGWHNEASMLWKMSGADMAAKRNELHWFIREMAIKNVRENEWIRTKDGYKFTISEKYRTMVKEVIRMFLSESNAIAPDKQGSWTMFGLRVFARDIITVLDNDGIVTDELATEMCQPREEAYDDYIPSIDEAYDADEVAQIMDDGSISFSSYDEEDAYEYPYDLIA